MSAGTPSSGNTVKNIIIGVLTTVAAYAIVHFLGLGKSGNKSESSLKKEATVNAWKSVNDYTNYAAQKFKTIACYSCDQAEMKKEMIRELDMNSNNLRNLKEDKNIDDKMQSMIDRAIRQFTDLKPLYSDYFDSLIAIRPLPVEQQIPLSAAIQEKFLKLIAHVQNRDTSEFQNYLRDVNKKYKTKLVIETPKLEFEPEALPGKWKVECSFDVEIRKDGTLTWTQEGLDYQGTWKLVGDRLKINLVQRTADGDTNQELDYTLLLLSKRMMVYYNPDSKGYMAACPQ